MILQMLEVHWMACSHTLGHPYCSNRLLLHHSTLLLYSQIRREYTNFVVCDTVIREADAHLPPGPVVVYSERARGAVRLNIFHIENILHILTFFVIDVLMQRVSKFSTRIRILRPGMHIRSLAHTVYPESTKSGIVPSERIYNHF